MAATRIQRNMTKRNAKSYTWQKRGRANHRESSREDRLADSCNLDCESPELGENTFLLLLSEGWVFGEKSKQTKACVHPYWFMDQIHAIS